MSATNELAKRAERQLEGYKRDPNTTFDLSVVIEGTELQKAVWKAMCAIPLGKTRTYGELARELGADPRDIGQCCGDNRLPLVIPCHRIVAGGGRLGGYVGGVARKRRLLALEGARRTG